MDRGYEGTDQEVPRLLPQVPGDQVRICTQKYLHYRLEPCVHRPPPREPSAADVVAAFVVERRDRGLDTPADKRAIIGKYAKVLLGHGWTLEVVVAATKAFAVSRRHPRFLEEWVRETYWKWQDVEHAIRRAEEQEPPAVVLPNLRMDR